MEELQVPYVIESFKFNDVKEKPYTDICPNGRVPDDQVQRSAPRKRIPSAMERYNSQVHRFLDVLNTCLEGKTWLVGDKCTYADLAFVPWNCRLEMLLQTPPDEDPLAQYPNVQAWHNRMVSRPSWKRCMEVRDKLMDDQGLTPKGMPKGINNIKEYEDLIAREAAEKEKQ
ncbi:hypothetical protein APSETT445_006576 [Aspergillus pseudonomiae]